MYYKGERLMSKASNFPDRADRLSRFFAQTRLSQDFALLKSTQIPAELFTQLTTVVKRYLIDTLQSYYGEVFSSDENILKVYRDSLLGLPNITPNGLFLPKKTTSKSYNAMHRATVDIIEALGMAPHIDKMQLPIGLRLVNGKKQAAAAVGTRPYATTKAHLDIWAGEPTYAFMAFMPLFGETELNGVAFHEPVEVARELLKPLDDYLGGQALLEGASCYPARFNKGELIVVDPFLMHNTLKQSDELRLSLEFRILPKQIVASDIADSGITHDNYIPYAQWRELGRGQAYLPNAPLGVVGEKIEIPPVGSAVGEIVDLSVS
jgi:hypothetical protein